MHIIDHVNVISTCALLMIQRFTPSYKTFTHYLSKSQKKYFLIDLLPSLMSHNKPNPITTHLRSVIFLQ